VKQSDFTPEASALAVAISERLESNGAEIAFKIYKASESLIEWLSYLVSSEATGQSDNFLDGLRASIVESAACGAAGLIRPAIFSMRSQIDIIFSWLYFKDHPVEWSKVEITGEGFMLKRDILEYLKQYIPRYEIRFAKLLANKTRKDEDPYRVLSAHVHAQGLSVLPKHGKFSSLVGSIDRSSELVLLQETVTEYISDVFLACFGHKWAALPDKITERARKRIGNDKIALIFN
jgi:hypothetical protein